MTRRPLVQLALGALLCATSLAGCSASSASSAPAKSAATAASASAATAASTSGVPEGSIEIYYDENAQTEIVLPNGHRIMIDVWDPTALSAPPTANDILLTTHSHSDHYVPDFVDSFPGKKLTWEVGPLKTPDATITGISTIHDEGLADGSDFIYVIDAGGFRIAHFGDFGADKLTDAQLAIIGKPDIAISQLANSFSSMDEVNQKGLHQMNQVKPRILIPGHLTAATAKMAVGAWKATFDTGPMIVHHDKLPNDQTVCFMGNLADTYGAMFNLAPPTW